MTQSPELELWRQSADRWARDADEIQFATQDATQALISALEPSLGQTLLDVACGPGDPSLLLAERVGPEGRVLSTDGVEDMTVALGARAKARGLTNVSTHVMAAEDISLADNLADGACCRFGAMFFADPDAALSQIGRVVKTGGRIVLVVWGTADENAFFTSIGRALDDAGAPALPENFGERTVFEYAEPGVLAKIAQAAGWTDVTDEHVRITMVERDVTPEQLFETRCEVSDRISGRADHLAPAARTAAAAAVAADVRAYVRGNDLAFPGSIRVIAGRAP